MSCPTHGVCAAGGLYYSIVDNATYALLETLSDGVWTATEAPPPGVRIYSVSCANATICVATGSGYAPPGNNWLGVIYILASGTWQLQPAPPLPPSYKTNLMLASVSCPDANDCVAVGSYSDLSSFSSSQGLILTLASGSRSVQEAPLPANANPEPNAVGLEVLGAVDCTAPGACVAGGGYVDQNGVTNGLIENLQDGVWTPSEAPVPAGAEGWGTIIDGISCPAVNACVADGWDVNPQITVEDGLVWTQSSSGWTVAVVSTTPISSSMQGSGKRVSGHAASNKTVLKSVSCVGPPSAGRSGPTGSAH